MAVDAGIAGQEGRDPGATAERGRLVLGFFLGKDHSLLCGMRVVVKAT